MADIKIKTHTTYTYETTDGREFDDHKEAEEWQQAIDNIKKISMLGHNFKPTTDITEAFYVHIKTQEQLEAFDAMQADEGLVARIYSIGYYYYDDVSDEYISVKKEMDRLQNIIESLDALGK